ncbi:MAG: right-handed parallel beta-helix repeat-containing protein, partial [Candidatus Thorarchaeota archaeon]
MRKSIVALVAFVLVLQPFAIMAAISMPIHNALGEEGRSFATAQEPGSRLEPGEYTNHVPFEIDGTSDFGVLGFPGSGSAASPYVIAGLNITSDVGQISIQIINTNAYFVIRDCYIDQISNQMGIMLENTTHGTIEYTTVLSDGMALYFMNANNTRVSHTLAYGNSGFASMIVNSEHVTAEWNNLTSTSSFGLYLTNGNYFTSTQNEVSSISGGLAYYIMNSNHSASTFDTAFRDFYVMSSHFFSASDLTSTGGTFGLFVFDCPNSDFTRCNTDQTSAYGGYFDQSPDTTITHSSFTDSSSSGVWISNGNNTVFSNNVIDETDNFGLYMVNCYSSEVSMNTVSNTVSMGMLFAGFSDLTLDTNSVAHTGSYGVYLENVDRPIITFLDVMDTFDDSFYFLGCDNGSLTDSSFIESNGEGVYGVVAPNWVITDNTFANIADIGLYCSVMDNVDIRRNDFTTIGGEGIRVDVCADAQVIDNTISDSVSDGLSVSDSPRLVVDSNMLTDCYAGFTIDNSINITVEQNTISGTTSYGMNLNNLDSPEIRNNIIQDSYHMGIYIDLVWEGVFENNQLTDCGIFFQPGYILLFYNQTMIGNTVNSKPIYYGLSANNLNLNGDNYGQ